MKIRIAENEDIETMSGILAESWKSAYLGIVNDEYLDAPNGKHWFSS